MGSTARDAEQMAAELPELRVQYADFARWERRWIRSAFMASRLAYWKQQLQGAPAVLELPYRQARPAVESHRGALMTFELGEELSEGVRSFASQHSTTPFVVLLSAFKILLSRLSVTDDIVVGTASANRLRAEVEPLIGLFANTLVLRTDLSGDPSFAEVVCRVQRVSQEAQAHQELPFERLVEVLQPTRSLSHNPVFQVMMVMQPAAAPSPTGMSANATAGLESAEPSVECMAKFDLNLTFAPTDSRGYAGTVEYATDLFDDGTIRRWVGYLRSILGDGLANAYRSLAHLELMPTESLLALVDQLNERDLGYGGIPTVVDLLDEQLSAHGSRVAVVHGERELTYPELDAWSSELAERLRDAGAGPGRPVALAMPRSIETLVAVLAVLKAGAAYVPIDVAYPASRRRFMLENSGAVLVVTDTPGRGLHGVRAVRPRPPSRRKRRRRARTAWPRPGGRDGAYVVYTSGSTGVPKGVVMPHAVVSHLIQWQLERAKPQPGQRVLQFASLSFDVSAQEIFTAWLSGGTIVVIDEEKRADSSLLLSTIRSQRVDRVFLPYVALQALADEFTRGGAPELEALKEVIAAGEQLRITPVIRHFFNSHPQARLFNQYGPSETHIVSEHSLPPDVGTWPTLPSIGRPVGGARLYVLDSRLRPAPVGVLGEVYIGGAAVADGYIGQPRMTAERFLPDPFSGQAGARMYKSGDLARLTQGGEIDFVGRRDHQVKLRGYRIELGEIEARLNAHGSVQESVVIVREGVAGVALLVAYVVGDIAPDTLRKYLSAHLPSYMVPSHYVALDALPKTPSGKLARDTLPPPRVERRPGRAAATSGRAGGLEEVFAEQWSQLLGVEQVGSEEDFFELGGHSLLATRACGEAQRRVGVPVPVRALFEQPTARALAEYIARCFAERIETEAAEPFLDQVEEKMGVRVASRTGMNRAGMVQSNESQ